MKKNIKKLITFTIAGFFFLILFNQNVVNSKIFDNYSSQNFKSRVYDFNEPVNHLCASSHYDYGLKVGKRFRLQYKLLDILSGFLNNDKVSDNEIKDQINDLERYCPFFLDELKGLSSALNIRLEKLFSLQNLFYSVFSGECTATLATGKATKNNETFLTFNLDTTASGKGIFGILLYRLFTYKSWIVSINTLNYKYAFFGIPVIYEFPIINEKGLGWGSPGTVYNESRYIDKGPGIATMQLEKLALMTCKNVSEVASLYKYMERACQKGESWFHKFDGSSSSFCDKEGGILVIEHSHNYIVTVFGNSTEITGAREGILWHGNHHIWLDPYLTGSVIPSKYPSSRYRTDRTYELLNNSYGNITLDTCKQICRDHGGGSNKNGKDSYDICRHPDKNFSKVTSFAFIIQPKNMTVYWTHRSPCRSIFWKHDFSKIFGE